MVSAEMTGRHDDLRTADPRLTNSDLTPTPVAQRRWTWWNFAALWMGMVHNIFNFTWIGGLVTIGMSVPQALTIALVGNLVMTAVIGLNGRVGARFGIPFAVWARSAFGVYGANIPAMVRALVAIGWFGVQSYLAATAVNLLFSTVIPGWQSLSGASWLGMPANLWITMVLYWALNFLVLRKGMHSLRRFESWAGPAIFVVMGVLLVWALNSAHGFGELLGSPSKYPDVGSFLAGGFFPALALYIAGSWASMVVNIPDLTRFARSNRGQFWGTMIGLPAASLVYFGMAAIIVSATNEVFGKTYWNPTDVVAAVGSPVFDVIGAVLLAVATISVNIPANVVPPAYDLTNLMPRLITFKRGAAVAMVIAFLYMPWKLLQKPEALYEILDNLGILLGPITGILIADFFVVRRRRLDVPALYQSQGRYRASGGFNIVGLAVMVAVSGLLFVAEFFPPWGALYDYAWFVGVGLGFLVYLLTVVITGAVGGGLPPSLRPAGGAGCDAADTVASLTKDGADG
jgi:nucleobase:cation symporter-1, NCS1 family